MIKNRTERNCKKKKTYEMNYKHRPEGRSPAEEQSVAQDQVQSWCIMPE